MIKWMAQGAIRIFPFSAPGVVNGHRSTSSVDRGAMRKLLVVIASLASFVLSACERTSIAPDEGVSASIEMPRGLGTSRAIEQNRLLLDAFVGTERLQFSRDGRIHRGRFELEDNRSYQLTVRFSYRARGQSTPIILAEIEPRPISLALVSRTIRVREEDYKRDFDEDNDGVFNIDEVSAGTDPLDDEDAEVRTTEHSPADLTPFLGVNQGDCRLSPSDEVHTVRLDALDHIAPRLSAGQMRYRAAFVLMEPGLLSLEHSGGEPRDTGAILFDRPSELASAVDTADMVRVVARSTPDSTAPAPATGSSSSSSSSIVTRTGTRTGAGTETGGVTGATFKTAAADGLPARLAGLSLDAGVYCLDLHAEGASTARSVEFSDLVISVSFRSD